MRRSSLIFSLALILESIVFASTAQANPITYQFSGFGDGSLGGVSFTGSAFSFTLAGDTANVSTFFGPGIVSNLPLTASFVINGVAGTISTPMYAFTNHNLKAAGFGIAGPFIDMHQEQLAGYNMLQKFDPAVGTLNFSNINDIETSAGSLTFTSISQPTFGASGGIPAPEPGAIALAFPLAGIIGTGIIRRKRRQC